MVARELTVFFMLT